MFEIQLAVWPQPALDLFASDQLTRTFHQKNEEIECPPAKLHCLPGRAKFSRFIVELEFAEQSSHLATPCTPQGKLYAA